MGRNAVREGGEASPPSRTGAFDRYVPRVLLTRLATAPDDAVQTLEGTMVFVDVSGFTRLSERLARTGKEGAEHLVDIINTCFTSLLADAYAGGGSLLKFGGDALLLWFAGDEHALRACASAVAMRRTLREVGRIPVGGRDIVLRMSVGAHSGAYAMFLVGGSHREYLVAGPAASSVVAMEGHAGTGQILISGQTAALLPERCLGLGSGPGILLAREPRAGAWDGEAGRSAPIDDAVAACLSTELRAHLKAAPAAPEHRVATVSFLQFGELDALLTDAGPDAAAAAVGEVVQAAQEAADRYEVCFLGSDIASDGGKLLFSAGAPRAVGDDEERMLLAMRQIIEAGTRLPVRIGVNRGYVFTGEIGPFYRRTYAVMGDVTNLAARLAAKAPWRAVYAAAAVLGRRQFRFRTNAVPPFMVKGKSRPVEAVLVEGTLRVAPPASPTRRLPLVGRQRERAAIAEAIAAGRAGGGRLIELVGETGSGKSRLLAEARELADEMRFVHTSCEAYTRETPYVAWRDPLRQLLGLSWDDPDEVVVGRLSGELEAEQTDLLPWLPLLGIVLDAETTSTLEVDELASGFRAAKLHEVVLRFLAAAHHVPTLVEIEHAHLMDHSSADLLSAMAAGIASTSWIVIVTRREAESGFVARGGEHLRIDLGPLSRDDALALAEASPEAHAIPPHLLELAVERSGGNPEFLIDLLASAAGGSGSLPQSIDAAVMSRIDALDPGDRVLVRRAAVLGVSFHPRRLRDVLDGTDADPDQSAWERLAPVFARDPDGHVRFKRPALREAAYEGLPFRVRRSLHARVAESLERELGHDVDADPAVLSLHFILAGDHVRAHRYALLGAERATARFAHADAARLYRRAIEAARGSAVSGAEVALAWERLGLALRSAGEPKAAGAAFTSARRLLAGDTLAQARLDYHQAQNAERSQSLTAAVRRASRGLRTLEHSANGDAAVWRARLRSSLAGFRQQQGRPADAERVCRAAIADAEAAGEMGALAHAYYVLDWALVDLGRPDEATHSERALEIYRDLGEPEREFGVLNNLGGLAYFRGDWDQAVEDYRAAGACCERSGNAADGAYTDCNVGEILSDQGHLEQAEPHLQRAKRVWSSTGDEAGVAYVTLLLGRLAVRRGDPSAGLSLLENAAGEFARMRLDADVRLAQAMIAETEAFAGDPARAIAIADRLLASVDGAGTLAHRAKAVALVRSGHRDGGATELEAALAAARARDAHYDTAAAIDAMQVLGLPSASTERCRERDAILARLHVERLLRPAPALLPSLAAG